MSDVKRPGGSRDISDLKQRLGLKKTGGGAPPVTGGTGPVPAHPARQTGVVAPPGMNLPPPPGVVHSQPVPVMPNAADDPFGAMNAMAAQQTMQRAPEMIIVNDGKPVENVGQQSRGRAIAMIAVPAALALLVGVAVGRRSQAANSFNDGLSGTKEILGNTQDRSKASSSSVAGIKRVLSDLDSTLETHKTQKEFRYDAEAEKELETLVGKLDVKADAVYAKIKANAIPADLAAQIVSFYAGIAELKEMVAIHTRSAKSDAMAFKKAGEKAAAATAKDTDNAYLAGQLRYGVLLAGPSEGDPSGEFGAKLVEIGPPFCGSSNNPASTGRCPEGESPAAFAYRAEPGAGWTKGQPAEKGEKVDANRLLLLLAGGVRDSLVQGSEGVASEVYYKRRLRGIYERVHGKPDERGGAVGGLLDQANKLEQRLSQEASKGEQFSFFL